MKKLLAFALPLLVCSGSVAQIGFPSGVSGVPSTLVAQTLDSPTITGTVSGAPTWGSSQAITLSTAAQPNVTSVGVLTAISTSGTASSTKACAAGYVRAGPNYCKSSNNSTGA